MIPENILEPEITVAYAPGYEASFFPRRGKITTLCNSRDFFNSGDVRYASKYLNVKGLPILTGLMNIPQKGVFQTSVARELTIRWYQLEDEIDKLLEVLNANG